MTSSGPLGREPAGSFNFEPPPPGSAMYLEPTPKRIRAELNGETIADSIAAMMLHEAGHQPVYYFPPRDVRQDLLGPSPRRTRCPKKGEASYWTARVGERVEEAIAWCYPEPIEPARPLAGLIAFYWSRIDRRLEEDEGVLVHSRDPYVRIDLRRTSRHVRISLDGALLADTRRALALFETNLPTRWYIPREDVVATLADSDATTACPYKGMASYHSVALPDGQDLVWCCREPLPGDLPDRVQDRAGDRRRLPDRVQDRAGDRRRLPARERTPIRDRRVPGEPPRPRARDQQHRRRQRAVRRARARRDPRADQLAARVPDSIEQPFRTGLHAAFAFAIAACLVAALLSALRGRVYRHEEEPAPAT